MQRLTTRHADGSVGIKAFRYYNYDDCQKMMRKLADYEDSEEQGLLLRLTCKVGDTVFHRKEYTATFTGIREYQITNIMISQNKKGEWTKKYRAMMLLDGKTIDCPINFAFDDIGKTVFLTKAKAEKALEEMDEKSGKGFK